MFASVVMSVQTYVIPLVLFIQRYPTSEGLVVTKGLVAATVDAKPEPDEAAY
jgi:hypothetical protein